MISTTLKLDTSKAYNYVIRQYSSKDVIHVLFQTGTSNRYIDASPIKTQVAEDIRIMQTDPYWSGYDDYKRGRHLFDNPYNYDTHLCEFLKWEEGYWVAYEEQMRKIEAIGDQARGPERPPPWQNP